MNQFKLKDKIKRIMSTVLNCDNYLRKKIRHGKDFHTYGRIIVKAGSGRISFGNHCILRSGIGTNPLGGSNRLILAVGRNGRISCGDYVGISNVCMRINSELIIEDHVNIGGDCKIYDSDFHSVEYAYRMEVPDTHIKNAPIRIKKGAWIGAHSIILKGVTIGERSVIGAGSVVTKNVPDDEVWAGNPARFIKKICNG